MKTPQERKALSEQKIRVKGIGVFEGLPMIPTANEVCQKSLDAICKRAIAALLSTQIACDISEQQYGNVKFFIDLMKKYGVFDGLNEKEKHLVNGMFDQQDVVDVVWEYECFWALAWALGLVEDIADASQICDCQKAVHLVSDCDCFEAFCGNCKPRDIEEILDMLDLYYRYHWACVQNMHVDKNLPIGDLNMEVVFERRRGLEWLISQENDWHEIALHT
jgi:hypothetical protein